MPSNIPLTFFGLLPAKQKALESIGFQIARRANRVRSETNRFENCTGRSTHKMQDPAMRGLCRSLALPNLVEHR